MGFFDTFKQLLPNLIGVGSTIGAGALGSKLAQSSLTPLEQQQLALANQAGQRGQAMSQNLFDVGAPAVSQPLNYWASLLSGDRSRMTAVAAPDISRIGQGYQQAAETSGALNPRGGPTPDFLANAPYAQQHDVSTLLQQARPQAATQLAGTGSNLLANSINALYGSTAAGRSILDYEQQRRAQDRAAGASLGKSVYDIFYPAQGKGLASVLGDIFNKPAATGSR